MLIKSTENAEMKCGYGNKTYNIKTGLFYFHSTNKWFKLFRKRYLLLSFTSGEYNNKLVASSRLSGLYSYFVPIRTTCPLNLFSSYYQMKITQSYGRQLPEFALTTYLCLLYFLQLWKYVNHCGFCWVSRYWSGKKPVMVYECGKFSFGFGLVNFVVKIRARLGLMSCGKLSVDFIPGYNAAILWQQVHLFMCLWFVYYFRSRNMFFLLFLICFENVIIYAIIPCLKSGS